jgi:hypothetical protein
MTPAASPGSPLGRLASKLGIDERAAETIYDIDEDGLHLVLAPSKLPKNVTSAMEQIARLVVAGRQAAGIDEESTSIGEIRAACQDRGRSTSLSTSMTSRPSAKWFEPELEMDLGLGAD